MKVNISGKWIISTGVALGVLVLSWAIGAVMAQGPRPVEPSSASAVNSRINYQGVLKENGSPVTGSRDMVFRLYADDLCSAQVGSDIPQAAVPVNDGLFDVALDVAQDDFDGQGLWLEVEVEGTSIGCREVLPAPYALSLRPGATVRGEVASPSAVINVNETANGWGVYGSGGTVGVYGSATLTDATTYGVYGASDSAAGAGVYGINTTTGFGGVGVRGVNTSTNGYAGQFEGRVQVQTNSDFSEALYVYNSGQNDAIRAYTYSDGDFDAAVYATSWSTATGIYAYSSSGYAGYFSGDIYVSGVCVGCTMVYLAVNDGGQPLETGDLVALDGMSEPLAGESMPVLRVQRVDEDNAGAVVGVVQSKASVVVGSKDGQKRTDVLRTPGMAVPDEYVLVIVQGLAQVKVDARSADVQAGDDLIVTGVLAGRAADTSATDQAPSIGRAMESITQETGLIWVMVDLQ